MELPCADQMKDCRSWWLNQHGQRNKTNNKVFYSFVYQRASGQNHINSAQQHESDFSTRIEYSETWTFQFPDITTSKYSINTSTTTPKHTLLPCPLRALPCLLRFGVFCQRTLQVCQTKWDCTGQWRFVFLFLEAFQSTEEFFGVHYTH